MAGQDFVPLFFPGKSVTCMAGAAISAGQVVSITGGTLTPGSPGLSGGTVNSGTVTPTVAPTTAPTSAKCGVASNTVPAGAVLAIWFDGWHPLTTAGSISAGDLVTAAASGGVADLGAIGSATVAELATVIGHAVSANASGIVLVALGI